MAELLTDDAIATALADLTDWSGDSNALRREFVFRDFAGALEAVNRIGAVAEEMDHHPDIDIRWNRVIITVSTHSAGGVTDLDLALVRRLDAVAPA